MMNEQDGELASLDGLADAAEQSARDERCLARRIRCLRAGRAEGRSWRDLLAGEQRPGVLELVSGLLARITETSGVLRRTLARGLRAEGATIAAIGSMFGVTHQRVSALLHRDTRHLPS